MKQIQLKWYKCVNLTECYLVLKLHENTINLIFVLLNRTNLKMWSLAYNSDGIMQF